MKPKGDEPTVTDGQIVGHENVGVVALLTPRGALSATPVDCQAATLLDQAHDETDHVIPWQPIPRRGWQQLTFLPVLPTARLHACALQAAPDMAMAQAGVLTHGRCTSALLLPTAKSHWSGWQQLRRLVGLSDLGWAFVVVAVGWELFALAFSRCAGWGWDKGAFFFAWGLGILAFGFYLRTSRQQPVVSRLFLGMNILVVSVFSFVVATR